MPPFGSMPDSRSFGLRKNTVTLVPSWRAAFVVPLPRSHSARWVSSSTMVLPRGETCAKPSGNTLPIRHVLAGNAPLMCSCKGFGMLAKTNSFTVRGLIDRAIPTNGSIARRAYSSWRSGMHQETIAEKRRIEPIPPGRDCGWRCRNFKSAALERSLFHPLRGFLDVAEIGIFFHVQLGLEQSELGQDIDGALQRVEVGHEVRVPVEIVLGVGIAERRCRLLADA